MVGAAPSRPPTRLDEATALALAAAALVDPDAPPQFPMPLVVRDVIETDDGTEWIIGTATRGSDATVRVADADGRVLDVRRRQGR